MSTTDDFMAKLLDGKKEYQQEQEGTSKRRRFTPGLDLRGRLLPYESGDSMRFLETFYHHYFESIRGDGWTFLACPKNGNEWDTPCSFCDPMIAHYKEHGSDNIYNAYKRKRKYKVNFYVTNVLTLPNYTVSDSDLGLWNEVKGKVVVLDLPFTVKEKIDLALNEEELGLNIFNPMNGFDLHIKVSLKKTDNGELPNYSLTEFSRAASPLPGDVSKILGDCAKLNEQIALLKKADLSRIPEVATAEGLVASNVSTSAPRADSTPPDLSSSSTPESTSTPETPTYNAAETESAGDNDSLQDIFNKYRK